MRYLVIAGALAALSLTAVRAGAQENRFSLSSPVAAPENAFELKVGTGYTQGFGRVAPTRVLRDVGGPGLGASLDLDYRLNPTWSVGVETQYQELSNEKNAWARGLAANAGATYHFMPNQTGDPFVRLGSGYRLLWERNPDATTGNTVLRHGFELASLKLGYDFRATEDIALAPVVGVDLDMFLWEKASNTQGVAYNSAEMGSFVYAGLQGRFDMGGTRQGGRMWTPAPEPVITTSTELPAPPPPPQATTPVSPSVAVSPDILKQCQLKLGSIPDAPKFEFDKSELLPADIDVLTQIATCFVSGPMKDAKMELVGRADPRGTVQYNDALGLRRAKSVESYFVSSGVAPSDISLTSRGKRDAVGTDEASWAIDRRVDVLNR